MRAILALLFAVLPAFAFAYPSNQTFGNIILGSPLAQIYGGTSIIPMQTPNWRACIGKMLNGLQNCRLVTVGDSHLWSVGSTSNSGNGTQLNLTDFMSLYLNQAGIPANDNAICGDGSTYFFQQRVGTPSSGTSGSDLRFSGGSGSWTGDNTGYQSLGGGMIQGTASSPNLVYTPITSYNSAQAALYPAMTPNKFNMVWWNSSLSGTMTGTATGGSPVTMTGSGAGAYTTSTATASATSASNALTLSATTVDTGYGPWVECIEPYNSAVPSVNIFNTAIPGAGFAYYANSTVNTSPSFDTIATIQYLNPALVMIIGDANDWDQSVPVSTSMANLLTLVNGIEATGDTDVLLVSGFPTAENQTTFQPQYIAALKQFAITNNIPFVDLNTIFVSIASVISLGLSFDNFAHVTSAADADAARQITNLLIQQ